MPLNPKASVSHNISEMVHAGHPQNQAVAAALNVARNAKAMGGVEDGQNKFALPKIVPPTDNLHDVAQSNFDYYELGGNKLVPISKLTGGVNLTHPDQRKRVDILKQKISDPENGYISRLVADDSGNIVEGQHRFDALRELGATHIPVSVIKDKAKNIDIKALKDAIRGNGGIISDHVNQLTGHIIDAAHESGSADKAREDWAAPRGFEQRWHTGLDEIKRQHELAKLQKTRTPRATGGGLYANIHAKQERIAHGSHEHMRRPGAKGAPAADAFRASERTAKADGGGFSNNQQLGHVPELAPVPKTPTMGNKVVVHEGPIHSPVAGRTDHLPMHVKSGSYVIPADIIGAMGEGNTMAGFKVARRMFSSNPYFQKSMSPYGSSSPIYNSDEKPYGARAAGGGTPGIGHNGAPQDDEDDDLVPIVAAGGEYVISPQDVTRLGEDDIDDGHKTLDSFVTKYRKKTIKVLQNLPGPHRD
jgi:hypothetical protein